MNLFTILGGIFIMAKVFGVAPVAGWSWFWVLFPLMIPVALIFGIAVLAAVADSR